MNGDKPFRVLLVSGWLPPQRCGIGEYTLQLARALASRPGVEVAVVTSAEAAPLKEAHLMVHPIVQEWDLAGAKTVQAFARSWNADVVHVMYPSFGYGKKLAPSFLPWLAASPGVRVVQTWHEPLSWKGFFRYLPNAFAPGPVVVVHSDYEARIPAYCRALLAGRRVEVIATPPTLPRAELDAAQRAGIRSRFDAEGRRLLVHFGYALRRKGVESIFDIADPERDRVALVCDLDPKDDYQAELLALAKSARWSGKAFVTGFVAGEEAAKVLAAADAAVFPFIDGQAPGYTTPTAASAQGTFVLTTHAERRGYDASANTFYARPGDLAAMRQGLDAYSGRKGSAALPTWEDAAEAHLQLYKETMPCT